MSDLKASVVGLGWFGEVHCEALSGLQDVELYALCTRTESRLENLADRFGVEHTYTDYNDLYANDEVDVVNIVTMWDQHTEPTLAALEAGKHVFLEKPMASTVADCQKIVDAANAVDQQFMVGHIVRFNPRYVAAKEEIEDGAVGDIQSIYARRNIPAAVSGEGILDKIGPIIGDGVHDTDIMLWYTGETIDTAYGLTRNVRGFEYPDIGWTMYRFESGAIGVCENVWYLPEETPFAIDERMEIVGTEGSIYIKDSPSNYTVVDEDGLHHPDTTYWPELRGVRTGALSEELDYFASCVRENQEPSIIRPEESMEAVRACLAAEASAESGRVESVPDFR